MIGGEGGAGRVGRGGADGGGVEFLGKIANDSLLRKVRLMDCILREILIYSPIKYPMENLQIVYIHDTHQRQQFNFESTISGTAGATNGRNKVCNVISLVCFRCTKCVYII